MLDGCSTYWWTNMIFMNDLIPFFDKDIQGCMRWTALFAIEMKLFLLLPILAYIYHSKRKAFAFLLSFSLFVIGLIVYGISLAYFKIAPGYLNLLDY